MATMQTRSGRLFNFEHPRLEDIIIEDIASGLSKQCRFAGQGQFFYSVAQHSVLVSEKCAPEDALWGLLHDAGEAYTGDCIRPLKRLLPEFKRIENVIQVFIALKFGLPQEMPESVHRADQQIVFSETAMLFGEHHRYPNPKEREDFMVISPWGDKYSEVRFMSRFEWLTKDAS